VLVVVVALLDEQVEEVVSCEVVRWGLRDGGRCSVVASGVPRQDGEGASLLLRSRTRPAMAPKRLRVAEDCPVNPMDEFPESMVLHWNAKDALEIN
jgi:hypothetical protein